MTFYVDSFQNYSSQSLARYLRKCILRNKSHWKELVFLCIGTDKITGDSLGPYIGYQLSKFSFPGVTVYGTLSEPVHALNLVATLKEIEAAHPQALVIAIDASLGAKKHLGYVTIEDGALYPGAGVQKKLPPVGDISITGIVNTSGFFEQFSLQSTRLSTVISMAESITEGILTALSKCDSRLRPECAFTQMLLR